MKKASTKRLESITKFKACRTEIEEIMQHNGLHSLTTIEMPLKDLQDYLLKRLGQDVMYEAEGKST